jgi:hypothetical protein
MTISLLVWILELILRFEQLTRKTRVILLRRGCIAWRGVLFLFKVVLLFLFGRKIGGGPPQDFTFIYLPDIF